MVYVGRPFARLDVLGQTIEEMCTDIRGDPAFLQKPSSAARALRRLQRCIAIAGRQVESGRFWKWVFFFVWHLILALLHKADENRCIQFGMPCLHDLKFWFISIGKQQSYLGSKDTSMFFDTYIVDDVHVVYTL
jgi:hypothetical protein